MSAVRDLDELVTIVTLPTLLNARIHFCAPSGNIGMTSPANTSSQVDLTGIRGKAHEPAERYFD